MQEIMTKKGFALGVGILLVVAFSLLLAATARAEQQEYATAGPEAKTAALNARYRINEIASEIENVHCKMTDKQMGELKLSADNIKRAREFCGKPMNEKIALLEKSFTKISERIKPAGKIVGFDNSYSCRWNGSLNTGIPTYGDLGLSYTSCIWHDSSSSACKVQGAVGCLWGCTNNDPLLGWHTKYFSSRAKLESEILPKGYQRVTNPIYGAEYRRTLPYGYSYEVGRQSVDSTGKGMWHVEGPESDPRFNWPGFLGGWWPNEVLYWHQTYNC